MNGRIRELLGLFVKLGFIGFGGPAAHIAMMRSEVVDRRRWLSPQRFLDLVGATNLIPGPNSTELAIHIGRERAGLWGLIAAGTAFIAPAMLIVLVLAWVYVRYGSAPAADDVLYGIAPVVIAIVIAALWDLTATAVKNVWLALLGVSAFLLYVRGVNELLVLAGAALVAAIVANVGRAWMFVAPFVMSSEAFIRADVELPSLFLLFLKFGSVVFGSGYVLLAFLRTDLVVRLGWLTNEQLIDAVSVGQFTPGPVFTTATFIGYLIAGFPGALLATLGIFLPSFLFVAALNPLIARIRRSPYLGPALDGVNVAAIGLMAGVVVQLGEVALIDPFTIGLAVVALAVILRFRPNAVWPVLVGAIIGLGKWLVT